MSHVKLKELKERIHLSDLLNKDVLTFPEAMVFYNMSAKTLRNQIKYYQMPCVKLSRSNYLFTKTEVLAWAQKRQTA